MAAGYEFGRKGHQRGTSYIGMLQSHQCQATNMSAVERLVARMNSLHSIDEGKIV
jgi:hypothetical protein